jgi:hypothetical protein
MRKITIPQSVECVEMGAPAGAPATTVTFAEFVLTRLRDPVFGTDLDAVESAERLWLAIGPASPGAELSVQDNDWERLSLSVRTPMINYAVGRAVSLLPLMRAVTTAAHLAGE